MEIAFDYILIAAGGAFVTGLILQCWVEARDSIWWRAGRARKEGGIMSARKSARRLGLRPRSSRLNFRRPLAPRFFSTGILRRMED